MLSGIALNQSSSGYIKYRPVAAEYRHFETSAGGPLPSFGDIGTGGLGSATFHLSRQGYHSVEVRVSSAKHPIIATPYAPFVELMQEIKSGFGRTMSYLPGVFGVSRQTLYNWQAGEIPKEHHHPKIQQLAAAAHAFKEAGFKPTPTNLEQTVAQRRSLLWLIGNGADGYETAKKLINIVQRGTASQAKLDAIMAGRKPIKLEVSDMGTPSFSEDIQG